DHVDNFRLDGDGLGARGELLLLNGALQSASFSSLKLSPLDDYAVNLTRRGGGMQISVNGAVADMRPVLTRLRSKDGATDGDNGSTAIKVKLDQAIGFSDERLSNVTMDLKTKGGRITAADFSAITGHGGPVVSQM